MMKTSALLSNEQIDSNKSILEGKTASDVLAWAENKMGGGGNAVINDVTLAQAFPEYAEMDYDAQEKVKTYTSKYIDSYEAAQKKALLESRESAIEDQLKNEDGLLNEVIYNNDVPIEQKIVAINEADLSGSIREDFAVEARRLIESEKEISAVTNADTMATLVTKMYDLNAIAETNPKDYLMGVNNIRKEIMSKRADGELSKDDELKLDGQIKSLMSSKVSTATSSVAISFGEGRKLIESTLPPEMRGEAIRNLFYATQEQRDSSSNDPEKRKALQVLYKQEAARIVDSMQKDKRISTLKAVTETKQALNDADMTFLQAQKISMSDVKETAIKHNITEKEVIRLLKEKSGG